MPIGHGKYGGIEKLCYDFVEGLNELGHKVTVAAPQGSVVPEGVRLIETVKLPEEQDHDDYALNRMLATDGFWDFDVAHDFSHQHWFGKIYPHSRPTISMLWNPITHKYSVAPYNIVCLSDWQRQRFEKLYNQKAIVMPMCVDTKKYRPVNHPRRERFLFLGKISPEKGVHIAIQYCRELGVPLDIVGGLIPSELNSPYLQSIRSLCDGKDIRLHFNVTEEEKIDFLQNARAVIYPVQQEEAHWLVGVEAWCCGTPTVVFNRGAMVEIMPNPHFACDNEFNFKNRIYRIEDYDVGWATRLAVSEYSRDAVLPKYLNLYERVANGERW